MVKICNLETLDRLPATYGYISLGDVDIVDQGTAADLLTNLWFKGEVEDDTLGVNFQVYIFNSGLLKWVVLGDLTCVPGNYVIQPDPLLEKIKEAIKEKREKSYIKDPVETRINDTGGWWSGGASISSTPTPYPCTYVGDITRVSASTSAPGTIVYDSSSSSMCVNVGGTKFEKIC